MKKRNYLLWIIFAGLLFPAAMTTAQIPDSAKGQSQDTTLLQPEESFPVHPVDSVVMPPDDTTEDKATVDTMELNKSNEKATSEDTLDSKSHNEKAASTDTAISDEKRQVIGELMEVTRMNENMLAMMKQMFMSMGATEDEFPLQEEDVNSLMDEMMPIYAKHFTLDELEKIVDFYNTPTGQKTIEKMPIIMQEGMMVGQQWGMEMMEKLREKNKKN